jgi:hypothetical protein
MSPERVERIIDTYEDGFSLPETAEMLGEHSTSVRRVLVREGIELRQDKRRVGGAATPTPRIELLLSRVVIEGECWVWTGAWMRGHDGAHYGIMRILGPARKAIPVHRFAYEFWNGPIPEKAQVKQRCGNRLCFYPDHLYVYERQPLSLWRDERNFRMADVIDRHEERVASDLARILGIAG